MLGARSRRRAVVLPAVGVAFAAGVVLALGVGSVVIAAPDVLAALAGRAASTVHAAIVWDVRLPRILLALLVGACLAVSGALLQAVVGNPLADPGLTGVTAGAASVVLVILLAVPAATGLVPPAAFAGGCVAAGLVYALAWRRSGMRPLDIILAGVAVNAVAGAVIGLLSLRFSDRQPAAIQRLNGSLAAKGMDTVLLLVPYAAVGLVAALACSGKANILRLGDAVAGNLGENVARTRLILSAVAVFLAAVAVAAVGVLGFLGLVVPHLARLLVGSDHRVLLPLSALLGALLLLVSDTIGRTAFAPVEIPAGIVMAFVGAPYFLFLLRRSGAPR
ncbi:iron-hydroxamate transporter permease subunit [Leifsonia xyli subsp. cynodontis DSM 46306]|uniref:Iron ABC transporter permease n=1 Tax=Leifsonia xyli subsp. cynodontis DSM 46306 TaxID=1389489 RepID=U3P7Q5_LEIXC|nr:iron-hydroxamate transporter permease subunit [Leifsonia xyli subsp. cynodontis DSM 46306]